MDEIPLLPPIPDRLRLLAKEGIVIPFVGAGVSQLGGCPGWDEFATAALRFFVESGKLDHAEFDQLARLPARVKISVAVGLQRQHDLKINFKSILAATAKERLNADKVYGHLAELARTFITTNYDEWLDVGKVVAPTLSSGDSQGETLQRVHRTVHYRVGEFDIPSLSVPDTVFHIHGSLLDAGSMVLTTSDYVQRYASHRLLGENTEENSFLTFLGHLFLHKSVLFVGYGLSELEVLEFVIQKARGIAKKRSSTSPNEEPRHFMLHGFFSHEVALMRSLRDYYLNECGVQLLPFLKDQKGWHQLVDVLEYLATEIPVNGLLASAKLREMEGLLE